MSISRSGLAAAQGWVYRRQRRRVIAAAVLIGLSVASIQLLGGFSLWDAALQSRLASFRAPLFRPEHPLLISLDAATLARWGPPPFAAARWRELAEALAWAGIREAYLVDAPELVIAADDTAVLEGYLQRCAFDDRLALAELVAAPVVGDYLTGCLDARAFQFLR